MSLSSKVQVICLHNLGCILYAIWALFFQVSLGCANVSKQKLSKVSAVKSLKNLHQKIHIIGK